MRRLCDEKNEIETKIGSFPRHRQRTMIRWCVKSGRGSVRIAFSIVLLSTSISACEPWIQESIKWKSFTLNTSVSFFFSNFRPNERSICGCIFENNSQLSTVTNRFSFLFSLFSVSLETLLLFSSACNFLPAVSACYAFPVVVNSRFLPLHLLSLSFHDRIP